MRRLASTLQAELTFPQSCPPGHFYSPIPSRKELANDRERIFCQNFSEVPEVEIRGAAQLQLLSCLAKHFQAVQLPVHPQPPRRFYLGNDYFFGTDAAVLAAMLLENQPAQYVEIGSGYSSALVLDIRDEFLIGKLACVFVEPDVSRLNTLLRGSDKGNVVVHEERVQKIPDRVFQELGNNDILFVDGSHVSKAGSDLNDIVFRVLPLLNGGVLIHFHDIFWPFEYAEQDVMRGRSWNEAYFVRAFLANNVQYQIELFPSWLEAKRSAEWDAAFPGLKKGRASSLWLRKSFSKA